MWELFIANVRPHGLDNALFWSPPGSCLLEIKRKAAMFKMEKARCFDPKDTKRIKTIISHLGGGVEQLEESIRSIAEQIGTTDKYAFESKSQLTELRQPSLVGPSVEVPRRSRCGSCCRRRHAAAASVVVPSNDMQAWS